MTEKNKREGTIFGLVVAILVSLFYGFVTLFLIPRFGGLFEDMEAKRLPPITEFAFATYPYWNVFSLIALLGSVLVFRGKIKVGWILLIIGAVSVVAVIPYVVHAMYAPVFELGKEI